MSLNPPGTVLERARWYCLLGCFANVAYLSLLLPLSGQPVVDLAEDELALATTGVLLFAHYRRTWLSLPAVAGMSAGLFACALNTSGSQIFVGLLFMLVCLVSLDDRAPRIVASVALLSSGYVAGAALQAPSIPRWLAECRELPWVPVVSLGFASLASVFTRFQDALATEQALADASAALVAALDTAAVHRAAASGCVTLMRDTSARVSLWLNAGNGYALAASAGPAPATPVPDSWLHADPVERTDRIGSNGDAVHLFPLRTRGARQGLIVTATAKPLSEDQSRLLAAFARQVSLALANAGLVEQWRRSEARFRSIVRHTSDVVIVLDPDGTIQYASDSIGRLFQTTAQAARGRHLSDIGATTDTETLQELVAKVSRDGRAELTLSCPDGVTRHVEVAPTDLLRDPDVQGTVLVLHDITERKTLQTRLEQQAFHDALTGLANRALFMDRLRVATLRAARNRTTVAVLFVDLDNFKAVNDTFGHAAGDAMLSAAASRLQACLREMDTAARLGGDELAAIIEGAAGVEEAATVAERILVALRAPLRVQGRDLTLSASIGLAVSEAPGDSGEELLSSADQAMYEAKRRGKNCCVVADPRARAKVHRQRELQTDLRQAIQKGDLSLVYRPIVSLSEGRVVGIGALPHWDHPRWRAVLPGEIVSASETIGAGHVLGSWMLRTACAQAVEWDARHPAPPLAVSVRLSLHQLVRSGFAKECESILSSSHIAPHRIILELTGGDSIRDAGELHRQMRALKDLGLRLAIDGWGTGRTPLMALPHLPLDVVKIDKAFVDALGSEVGNTMACAIAMLGRILHVEVIAEGIERPEQVELLKFYGCDLGEGRYFSAPLPASAIDTLLEAGGPLRDVVARLPRQASSG